MFSYKARFNSICIPVIYSLSAAQTAASTTAYPGYEAAVCSGASILMAHQSGGGTAASLTNKPIAGKPGTYFVVIHFCIAFKP